MNENPLPFEIEIAVFTTTLETNPFDPESLWWVDHGSAVCAPVVRFGQIEVDLSQMPPMPGSISGMDAYVVR